MKYRGSTEIIDSMLRSIGSGATKTHIMYRAYLSFSQLTGYLSLLEERGLIFYQKESHLYRMTEKGLQFMTAFEKICELIPTAEERNETPKKSIEVKGFNY
jgi:predicted transcriptional regulator